MKDAEFLEYVSAEVGSASGVSRDRSRAAVALEPYKLLEKPVPFWVTVTVNFRLT